METNHFDAKVVQIANGWATILLNNGTLYDCWNFPRELKIGDKLIFNTQTRGWELTAY